MANINELLRCWGFGKQADIATPNLVGAMWRMTNLNPSIWAQNPVNENNAAEVGKGHEFPTQTFKSHYAPGGHDIRKYLCSEFSAWALCFCLGNVVKSGTNPWTYTVTPILGSTNPTELELPYFTYVQQIRPGGSAVLDQKFHGCAINSLALEVSNGPGRSSAMLTAGLITTGKYTEPSGITMPAETLPHEMNAGGLTALTINGIDYFATAKDFISFNWGWNNNLRPGFFPGSGSQDGYQVQGRLEIGDRSHAFSFVARYKNGSTELTKLRALTSGTVVITFVADSNNSLQITEQEVVYEAAVLGDAGGIVTVGVTATPRYNATNGLVTVVAKCQTDGICQ